MPHREVRRVPSDWKHPRNPDYPSGSADEFVPLHDHLNEDTRLWDETKTQWEQGFVRDYPLDDDGKGPLRYAWKPLSEEDRQEGHEEYYGQRPDPKHYMPDFPAEQRTHWQMYEITTEGTPMSPIMDSAESLAHWLAASHKSLAGSETGNYREWLDLIHKGSGGEMTLSGQPASLLFPASEPDQPESGPAL